MTAKHNVKNRKSCQNIRLKKTPLLCHINLYRVVFMYMYFVTNNFCFSYVTIKWSLHFAWVVDDAKCILVTRVCVFVCLFVCVSIFPLPHAHTTVTWGNDRGCPLVVHCLADLQSVHGFRCYDHIAPNAKCQRVLVLALCLITHLRFVFVKEFFLF